jgi:hypothetical protein
MMGRVIKYWLVLGAVAVVMTYGTAFLVFRHIDLSFVVFASVLCAPWLQAAVLVWRAEQPAGAVTSLAQSLLRHSLAQPVLVLDGLVLGAGIVAWDTHVIGLGSPVNIHTTWTLVKGAAAVVFCGAAVARAAGRRATTAWQMAAPLLLVFALEPSTSWLAAGFARANEAVGPQGEVVQRLIFYGVLFFVLVGSTLRSARRFGSRCREAGGLLQAAVAAAIVLAVTVVLACFNLPVVTQPWLGIAALAASAATTCVLLAAIFLATAERE